MSSVSDTVIWLNLACLIINGTGVFWGGRQYWKRGYLSPSVIAHMGLIFYGSFPVLFMMLAPESSAGVFGRYNIDDTGRILNTYVFASIGCIASTLFIPPIRTSVISFASLRIRMYIISSIGAIGLLWIYDRTWAQVGGIYGFIFSGESRMVMNESVFGQSIYSFFNYYVLSKIFLSLLCLAIFSEMKTHRKICNFGWVSICLCSIFPLMNLIGGTRLVVLNALIITFVTAAAYYKIKINLKLLLAMMILFMSFNYIGQKRSIIRQSFADGVVYAEQLLKDAIAISFIPSEAFTGYIPAYIIFESGEEKFTEPQYMKLMPRTVAKLLNLPKKEHLSKLLAIHGKYARNQVVFTVSLPVDAYFGLGRSYIFIVIYTFFVFSFFNWIARYLVGLKSFNGWYLYLVLMGLVWVYIRYDINRSFSRTWQTLLFSLPILLMFYNQKGRFYRRVFVRKRLSSA